MAVQSSWLSSRRGTAIVPASDHTLLEMTVRKFTHVLLTISFSASMTIEVSPRTRTRKSWYQVSRSFKLQVTGHCDNQFLHESHVKPSIFLMVHLSLSATIWANYIFSSKCSGFSIYYMRLNCLIPMLNHARHIDQIVILLSTCNCSIFHYWQLNIHQFQPVESKQKLLETQLRISSLLDLALR